MASAPPDERVYTDFKDEARTCPTNIKFKTTNERIQLWVKALEEIYPDVKLWDYKQKTKQKLVSLKIRDTDNGNLIIKFHLSTGVVVIQGSQYQSWGANEYASIKARVNALSDSGAVLEKPSDQDAVDSSAADPSSAAGHATGLIGNRTADDLHSAQNSDTKRAYHDIHTNHVSDGKVRDCDDAISKLEVAYLQLCDNTNDNLNNLKSEMLEIKAEIRKMPLKIMDLIKKDIKGINNSVSDMVSVISESESYKAQINQLTEQLQHQCKDMWKLQRSLAAAERTAALLTTASRDSTMTSSPTRSGSTGLSPSPAIAPSPTTESSAMGGDRTTSREAIVSHTPDRDSNPVPSSPNIPNGILPHHEAVTTGTEDPDDDGVHRGSAASRDLAADAVAPVPLGSQASAPGPDMVSQLNDDSPHTEGDDANETFTSPQRRRSQREHLRQQADVILITDSTGKYVDSSRFMGRQNYTFHERASTSDTALRNLNRWTANDNVKFVVLHNGVNDVRDGKTVSEIVDNLKSSLSTTKKRFTRAQSAYSEMLYIGSERSNPEQNEKVKDINRQIRAFCQENGHYFVAHNSLQIGTSDLYDDDVHISRGGGTALFVNDIHKTLIRRSRPAPEHFQRPSGGRIYFGRSDGSRQANNDRGGPRQAAGIGPVSGDGS